jgi:predicted nucleic acid-binding protein
VIVVDASVILELLLNRPPAERIAQRILTPEESLHVPHLLDLEVAQVLRRYVLGDGLRPARAGQALDDLADLPLNRYPHDVLLPRIWELRHNLSAYDAAYVALAETLDAVLLTRDERLAKVRGQRAVVVLI